MHFELVLVQCRTNIHKKKLAGLVSPSNKSGSHFITYFFGFFVREIIIEIFLYFCPLKKKKLQNEFVRKYAEKFCEFNFEGKR